jgi:hypothetical protein
VKKKISEVKSGFEKMFRAVVIGVFGLCLRGRGPTRFQINAIRNSELDLTASLVVSRAFSPRWNKWGEWVSHLST